MVWSRKRLSGTRASIAVHPTLRGALKARAAIESRTMVETLHGILCRALDRVDLIEEVPPSREQPRQSA